MARDFEFRYHLPFIRVETTDLTDEQVQSVNERLTRAMRDHIAGSAEEIFWGRPVKRAKGTHRFIR